MTDYVPTARIVGKLLNQKREAYGGRHTDTGRIMEALFPDGVPKETVHLVPVVSRILDKLMRLCKGNEELFKESPWLDIAGYAILMLAEEYVDAVHGPYPNGPADFEDETLVLGRTFHSTSQEVDESYRQTGTRTGETS